MKPNVQIGITGPVQAPMSISPPRFPHVVGGLAVQVAAEVLVRQCTGLWEIALVWQLSAERWLLEGHQLFT